MLFNRHCVQSLNTIMEPIINEEMDYRVLSTLDEDPSISQRQMALKLDISLGKVNYCLKALISAGLVKVGKFQKHPKKSVYSYLLTPEGIRRKTVATRQFLNRKIHEYDRLEAEIKELREHLSNQS